MKPAWAKRTTTCTLCTFDISPGQQRIDYIEMVNGRPKRQRAHRSCYENEIAAWFRDHPCTTDGRKPRSNSLDLSPAQRMRRHRLLSRLSSLYRYYIPKLNPTGGLNSWAPKDRELYNAFAVKRREILEELLEVGGIPRSRSDLILEPVVLTGNPNLQLSGSSGEA